MKTDPQIDQGRIQQSVRSRFNPLRFEAPTVYTAARIAAALRISARAVRKGLGGQAPCSTITVRGQETQAWTLAALPTGLRRQLEEARIRTGHKTIEELLIEPPQAWHSPVPFPQLPAPAREEAVKWRDILAPLLAQQHREASGELFTIGRASAQRILGEGISDDTLRRRFDLAIERDNGVEQWQNLDLYVAPGACAAPASDQVQGFVPLSALWPDLPDHLAELDNKLCPTAEDVAHLFNAAFVQFEAITSADGNPLPASNVKRRLITLLRGAVPALAKTEASLRRAFNRKLTQWQTNGRTIQAILDRRDKSGRKAPKLCPTCRDLVKGTAVELDGNLAHAWRQLQIPPKLGGIRAEGHGLCDSCAAHWNYDVRQRKSYVPASVRGDVGPEIQSILVCRHGPKSSRLASPYVRRDWGDLGPGDSFEADDVTWNHAFYVWDPTDASYVGRGECLILIDRRTDYVIGYRLIPGRVTAEGKQIPARYNAVDVRRLILHGNDSVGLPHKSYLFENGVWAARLVDGDAGKGWDPNPWTRTAHGLSDPRLGVEIRHATARNPRTKVIEGLLKRIQDRMRPQPGFVGTNERLDKREAMQDFLRRVRAGNEHPGNELLSMEQFRDLLDQEISAFVLEPQNGARLPRVSPQEAWQNGIDGHPGISSRPLRKLEGGDRALLSTHRRTARVTAQGIRLRIAGVDRVFWDDALKPYQHRDIPVAINLEEPDLLHCLPRDAAFFTLRERVHPSSSATPEELADSSAARHRWMSADKAIFDKLPHPLRTNIVRDGATGAASNAEGNFINAETAAAREARKAEARQKARLQALAGALDVPIPACANPRQAAAQMEALERLAKRRESQLAEPRS